MPSILAAILFRGNMYPDFFDLLDDHKYINDIENILSEIDSNQVSKIYGTYQLWCVYCDILSVVIDKNINISQKQILDFLDYTSKICPLCKFYCVNGRCGLCPVFLYTKQHMCGATALNKYLKSSGLRELNIDKIFVAYKKTRDLVYKVYKCQH